MTLLAFTCSFISSNTRFLLLSRTEGAWQVSAISVARVMVQCIRKNMKNHNNKYFSIKPV